ncbi:hypothetical protein [uncultured Campylobacter sp.]|uniref:hypothetical protein n=1 Tax=uncultured Campylobacter sp. TaxID=218934 RepID=UPI0028E5E550|nr:hypothetical protein [uncultured Campylobacter sp.]
MRKILIFCALSALALGAQNACEEYVKQSKIYLNELYEMKAKQLENDPQAFRLFELKFSELQKAQAGQEALIKQNGDEKFCERESARIKSALEEIKSQK